MRKKQNLQKTETRQVHYYRKTFLLYLRLKKKGSPQCSNIYIFLLAISDAPADSCCVKRKSTAAADAAEDAQDGASPEKKSRLEEKCAEAENNGDAEEATA